MGTGRQAANAFQVDFVSVKRCEPLGGTPIGIAKIVSRETIRKWANRFGRHVADCIKRDRPPVVDKWHLDEVVISINGRECWLWRAIGAHGDVLDFLVQP